MIGRLSIEFSGETVSSKEIASGFHHLYGLMKSEMRKRLFFVVDPDKRQYFKEFDLRPQSIFGDKIVLPLSHFGQGVDSAFPSAHLNILEAGNALVFGLNNAAVYHLMRITEVGLRALAWDRRVVPRNKAGTPIPLELAEWGNLIGGIEVKVKAIQNWRAKLTRENAHQFYNRLLVEIRAFNDGWRRHVMHSRSHNYEDAEAIALWGHVMRFMQTMAIHITESKRTPMVWKK
jgi:hypothetical protein